MRDYNDYVQALLGVYHDAGNIETSALPRPGVAKVPSDKAAKPVLMLSPHPDDEMLIGALPLRFMRQCGIRVVNVSLTLGSKRERQAERLEELKAACAYIGFETRTIGTRGLEGINPEAKEDNPIRWDAAVDEVASIITDLNPAAIFYPHALDANRTHIGVHRLVAEALPLAAHPCQCFQTEFWAPMGKPNLAVESTAEDLANLITALSKHCGEIARNPYHLRLPMWMMDNVRRGAELVGSQGGVVPAFDFATLYKRSFWNGTRMEHASTRGVFLDAKSIPNHLLQ